MAGQTPSTTFQVETDQTALSQDDLGFSSFQAASQRSNRILWTGVGFAVLMLMGLSANALVLNTSHNPSSSIQEVAFAPVAFAPTLRGSPTGLRAHAGAPGSSWARATGPSIIIPAASAQRQPRSSVSMGATTASAKESDKKEVPISSAVSARRFVVGGNWKANGTPESVKQLVEELNKGKIDQDIEKEVDVVCAAPFVYLSQVAKDLRPGYKVAAQNMWNQQPGAWTGETPAKMLTDMGIEWVVLGHSERRENCGETSQVVADKTKFAVDAGLHSITCIGEKLEARESGKTFDVLAEQMKPLAAELDEKDWAKVVLAYEPVWAIGTGKVATPEQAEETHAFLRKWLKDNVSEKVANEMRIQYGGSVNADNSFELSGKPNIDGFLVGGASLQAESFTKIINNGGKGHLCMDNDCASV